MQGLTQLVGALRQKDYQTALNWHAHLMTTVNLGEMGTSMLGVKAWIAVAKQAGAG